MKLQMSGIFWSLLAARLAIGYLSVASFPKAEISNGKIHAEAYLPDTHNGYYRAARFDWSGAVASLTFQRHEYYGEWFKRHNPLIHDAITGPVEDFGALGYEKAKVGETFVKIGVGLLVKPREEGYAITTPYKIADPGKWTVRTAASHIDFTHILTGGRYAYAYRKRMVLPKGKAQMTLIHTLTNTGTDTIETEVYDHNFLVIDRQPTGPDFSVQVPFALRLDDAKSTDACMAEGKQIRFLRGLNARESVHFKSLKGYGPYSNDYDIRVENRAVGAGVRITGDKPLSKLVFWATAATICPEPYIRIKVAPGAVFKWKINYEYYTLASSK